LLNDLFDQLGHVTIAAHAKDYTVINGLLPHFDEAVIGDCLLDQDTFLRRMLDARPDARTPTSSSNTCPTTWSRQPETA
jgi:hypothetical protein